LHGTRVATAPNTGGVHVKRCVYGITVMILVLSLFLTACGSDKGKKDTNGGASTDSNSAAKVTLKIVGAHNELDPAVEIYKKTNPNVDVEIIDGTWSSSSGAARDKQLVMISSGQDIDIGKMVWGKEFFTKGVLTDLTDDIKTWDFYGKIAEGQKNRMTLDGHIYGVTFGNNSVILFYNKDILAKVGVTDPPKTIPEMMEIAKKIKAANLTNSSGKPVYTVNFEGGNWFTDYWLWSLGGKQMNDDYTKTLIDSPESIKAYQTMQDFVKNGWAPKIDGSYNQAFINGQLAFFVDGTWDINAYNDAKLNWGTAPLPAGPNGEIGSSVGGIEYGIFKTSKHKKEALDFLKVIVSDEYLIKAGAPLTDAQYDDPQFQETWKKSNRVASMLIQKEQIKHTHWNFLEAPFHFADASKIYSDALQKVLVRLDDPAAAMKDAAAQINKGIEDEMKNN
jgi:multiple sugar transport system substrate-binding protein